MTHAAKDVLARLEGWLLKEQEARRRLEEAATAARVEVQDLVSQATQRVYQLRNRNVVAGNSESTRRRKAAKPEHDKADAACDSPPVQEADQAGPSIIPSEAGPEQITGPQQGARPEPPQGQPTERPAPEGVQQGPMQTDQEQPAAGPSKPPTAAGQKRGRQPARSAAASKRAKAQAAAAATADAAATAMDNEAPQPPIAEPPAGVESEKHQLPTAEPPSANETAPDTGANAQGATEAEQQGVGASAAAQPQDGAPAKASRARGKARKQQDKQQAADVDEKMGPADAAAAPSAPPAVPAPSPRVTRSRRGAAAAAGAAPLAPAPAPVPAKPTRGKGARQKRDVQEAQLGSPGLNPKTKVAVEADLPPPLDLPPAPEPPPAEQAAMATEHTRPDGPSSNVPEAQPGPPEGQPAAQPEAQPEVQPEAQPEAQADVKPEAQQEAQPSGPKPRRKVPAPPPPPPPLPPPVRHHHAAGQTVGRPEAQLQAQLPVQPIAQSEAPQEAQPAAQSAAETSGPQPRRKAPAPPPPPPPLPPPVRHHHHAAGPSAGAFARMPATIAATVAMLGGKPASGGLGVSAPSTAAAYVGRDAAGGNDAEADATGQPDPAEAHTSVASAATADTAEGFPQLASTEGRSRSLEGGFCFGTQPSEHASPVINHFGLTSDQGPSAGGSTAVEGGDGGVDVRSPPEGAAGGPGGAEPGSVLDQLSPLPSVLPSASAPSPGCGSGEQPNGHGAEEGVSGQEGALEPVDSGCEAANAAAAGGETRHRSLSLAMDLRPPSLAGLAGSPQLQEGTGSMGQAGDLCSTRAGAADAATQELAAECGEAAAADGVAAAFSRGSDGAQETAEVHEQLGYASGQVLEGDQANAVEGADGEQMEEEEEDAVAAGVEDVETTGVAGEGVASHYDAAVAEEETAMGQHAAAAPGSETGASGAADAAQANKVKGSNLVSSMRSFLPTRVAPSPPPAAGKKQVKVKALEAAQAARQKEAARAAERAQARAAAAERRQGQPDANGASAAATSGVIRPLPAGAHGTATARPTPVPASAQADFDAGPTSTCTTVPPAQAPTVAKSTATIDDRRNDAPGTSAATTMSGSVKAKAAFFQAIQAKEEQAKRAAVEVGGGRKALPTASGTSGAAAGTYKAGAQTREAPTSGEENSAAAATVAAAQPTAAAVPPNASASGPPRPPPAPVAETAADKHKRVEAKRKEEEERRRAELEARTKAKDDKLRNFEAAKQQQRQAGTAAALRPPAASGANPLAAIPAGKRPPINTGGAGAGPSAGAQVKPEPESNRTGAIGPSSARTPGPKKTPGPKNARTPGAKAGTAAASMVSPAVQMQIKLLPAIHPQNVAAVKAEAAQRGDGGAVGPVLGVPKPLPPRPGAAAAAGAVPQGAKQAQPQPLAAGANSQHGTADVTPGAADLTEEERRNVYAIQTSPYVMQVKPRTPGAHTATKQPLTSYEISPYRSDSESVGSDDDDDSPAKRRRKPLPEWAAPVKVLEALQAQRAMDADAIFGACPKTIDIIKVFSDMPPPGKTDMRGRPRRDYTRRGSSGIWDADEF